MVGPQKLMVGPQKLMVGPVPHWAPLGPTVATPLYNLGQMGHLFPGHSGCQVKLKKYGLTLVYNTL